MNSRIHASTTTRVGLATALLTLTLLALPNYASAVENGGVGGRPAYPQDGNDRSQSIFLHTLDKGQSVTEGVKLFNNTDSVKTIEVYAVDALISSGGAFSCEQKADTIDKIGAWVNLPVTTIELGPNQQKVVDFTITVPNNADVGEHNACVAMASVEPPSQSSVQGVQLSFRSAIRVAITVPGDIVKSLSISKLSHEVTNDTIIATQTLKNDGNVSLDTTIKTSLKNKFGSQLGEQGGEFVALSANETDINYSFERPMWGGWYTIDAEATYSDDLATSLGEDGGTTKKVTKSVTVFIAPSSNAALLYSAVTGVLLGGILYRVYSKKRKKRVIATAAQHIVNDGETIVSIAALHNVAWKKLAKLNKLKAPYALVPNATLLIPVKSAKKKQPATKKVVNSEHATPTVVAPQPAATQPSPAATTPQSTVVAKPVVIKVQDKPAKATAPSSTPKVSKTSKSSKKSVKKSNPKTPKKPAAKNKVTTKPKKSTSKKQGK